MDILIIGNGFDLAHGLKTSYKDFLDYCEKLPLDDDFRSNLWLKHFITKQKKLGDTWIDLETEIYNVITKINNTILMSNWDGVNEFLPKVLTVYKNNMPFDFFNITDFLVHPTYVPDLGEQEYTDKVYTDITEIFYAYIKTPKGFVNFLYDQLRDFTKAFEIYLTENINLKPNLIKSSPYTLSLLENTTNRTINLKVISFNYTNICETFYKSKLNSCLSKIETVYIHGNANTNTDGCNLVLGTHSFDRINNEDDKKLSMDLNIFQKHNQRHKYGTIEAYQDFLKKITDPRKIIYPVFHVIGHSLDQTDHNILNHIFTANKNTIINIYYHNEEAQEKLINNITEIIGEAEVMAKVRFIDQHNDKRALLKRMNS